MFRYHSRLTRARWPAAIAAVLCIALGAFDGAGAAAAAAPGQSGAAQGILDAALDKAWAESEPREYLRDILFLSVRLDARRGCDGIRRQSDRLLQEKLPPARHSVHGSFAAVTAPHDLKLRNFLLRRGIAEARVALGREALWTAKDEDLRGLELNRRQAQFGQEKQFLTLSARLWECVLRRETEPEGATRDLRALLDDARAAGHFGGDEPKPFDLAVRWELADLDPPFLLSAAGLAPRELAEFSFNRAYNRWLDGQRDAFTGLLITHAMNNGVAARSAFNVYMHYDLPRAWALAQRLPSDSNDSGSPRGGPLSDIVTFWAWQDPDAALAAAEGEPDADTRRTLVQCVAQIWAYKKPEQIERAVRKQDNAVRRKWAREAAAAEIAWRKGGGKPHDLMENQPRSPRMTPAQRKEAGIPLGNEEENRILENPADTTWLEGPHRLMFLRQAGSGSYSDTGKLDGIFEIIAGLRDRDEIDEVLCYNAEYVARRGAADDAVALLRGVRSGRRFVRSSCQVVRKLLADPE